MNAPHDVARRMFDLIEPVALVGFFSDEPNDEMAALGFTTYWDGYFAGRAAPLGRAPAEVVDAASTALVPARWPATSRRSGTPRLRRRRTPPASAAASPRSDASSATWPTPPAWPAPPTSSPGPRPALPSRDG